MLKQSKYIVMQHLRNISNKVVCEKAFPRRIFSGIQPTGTVHIGNYLGAITNWLQLQNEHQDMLLSIVDLHSITLPQKSKELSKNILEMTATLLACGIDPNKTILFQQSKVPHHTELCWHLSCICTMARLAHLPQYKEKSKDLKDVPLGLFIYPVLQAADILLYKSTDVPVGEDQLQHLQLAQDLARMFNNRFGETFPIPKSIVSDSGNARLKSLRNPEKKMSKSEADPKSRIALLDSEAEIISKFKKAVTDFNSKITHAPNERPGVSNLIEIHAGVTGKSIQQVLEEAKNLDTLGYKLLVAHEVDACLKPIREDILRYLSEPEYLINVLQSGSDKAIEIAEKTTNEVRKKTGLSVKIASKRKHDIQVQSN